MLYKRLNNVRMLQMQNALHGRSMLSDGFAVTWWQGLKNSVMDLKSATNSLRTAFRPKKPAYKTHRELFSEEQYPKTLSDFDL